MVRVQTWRWKFAGQEGRLGLKISILIVHTSKYLTVGTRESIFE